MLAIPTVGLATAIRTIPPIMLDMAMLSRKRCVKTNAAMATPKPKTIHRACASMRAWFARTFTRLDPGRSDAGPVLDGLSWLRSAVAPLDPDRLFAEAEPEPEDVESS